MLLQLLAMTPVTDFWDDERPLRDLWLLVTVAPLVLGPAGRDLTSRLDLEDGSPVTLGLLD